MKWTTENTGHFFIRFALGCLFSGLVFGCIAASMYLFPDLLKDSIGFQSLRPLHVSSILFWILTGATGAVYISIQQITGLSVSPTAGKWHLALWIAACAAIIYCYATQQFGGREYWEFPAPVALLLLVAWLVFLHRVVTTVRRIKQWPVYVWMWLTGTVFFLFIFVENYLWLFPYFRKDLITDMTIQWKVNGSIVGAWNQLIYGTSFYLLDRISGGNRVGRNKLAFTMYFLGLFNLMFNWGHHIYTLPTAGYIKYIGYIVSMTEWIFFIRILYTWKNALDEHKKHLHIFPYRFIIAAEFWVFVNMGQAILMSIPAINIYTHGTHVTVAHAMGTTIGINTMILMAAAFTFLKTGTFKTPRWLIRIFVILQVSFFAFWLSLNLAGVQRAVWQKSEVRSSFSKMMENLTPWFIAFLVTGLIMSICFMAIILHLIFPRQIRKVKLQ